MEQYSKYNLTQNLQIDEAPSPSIKYIFLKEDYGWVDINNTPVNVGTWDPITRLATLYNNIDQTKQSFVIEVNNATIDGNNATIGDVFNGLRIIGQNNVKILNLIIKNVIIGIYIEYSSHIDVYSCIFTNNNISMFIIRAKICNFYSLQITTNSQDATGIFLEYSSNIIINKSKISLQIPQSEIIDDIYSGILTQFCSKLKILNNTITISNSIVNSTDDTPSNIELYPVQIYGTNSSLIKSNIISVSDNNIYISSSNNFTGNFISVLLGSQNSNNTIEDNQILTCNNYIYVISQTATTKLQGISLNFQNSSTIIKNNNVSVEKNLYILNTNDNMLPYAYLIGINLGFYNNTNDIDNNTIYINNNTIGLNPNYIAFNFILAVNEATNNIQNALENNTLQVKDNLVSKANFIFTQYSLVYINLNNTLGLIKNNNLNQSQGNGLTLVDMNDLTEISKNCITNNMGNGISLSSLTNTTNTSFIYRNNIANNNYGLYITQGCYYNRICLNNFISKNSQNILDNNQPNSPEYYCENYYSDYNSIGPYIIKNGDFEDKCPKKCPLRFK